MNAFQEHALHNAIEYAWDAIEKAQWYNAEDYANQAIGTVNVLWWEGVIDQDQWSDLRAIFRGWATHSFFEQRGLRTYDGATHV